MSWTEKVTCLYCLSTKPFIHVHGSYQCTECHTKVEPWYIEEKGYTDERPANDMRSKVGMLYNLAS